MAPESTDPPLAPEAPGLQQALARIDPDQAGIGMTVIEPLHVVAVRSLPGAGNLWVEALQESGVTRLPAPGCLEGQSVLAMWLSPTEYLLLTQQEQRLAPLREALRPGSHALTCSVDRSAGVVGIELAGPALNPLLERLVDAAAVPARAGQATRARCIDLPVVMMRLEAQRAWMLVDRPVAGTLAQWLVYAAASLTAH